MQIACKIKLQNEAFCYLKGVLKLLVYSLKSMLYKCMIIYIETTFGPRNIVSVIAKLVIFIKKNEIFYCL